MHRAGASLSREDWAVNDEGPDSIAGPVPAEAGGKCNTKPDLAPRIPHGRSFPTDFIGSRQTVGVATWSLRTKLPSDIEHWRGFQG